MFAWSLFCLSLAATGLALPMAEPTPPKLTFLYAVNLTIPAPIDVGVGPQGLRQALAITGGAFEGPKMKGR
jgi:hypothetical protein